MSILEPKIWLDGVYHVARRRQISMAPPEFTYVRVCNRASEWYEPPDAQVCFWPNVTCLECARWVLDQPLHCETFKWLAGSEDS